jgi:pimeloyl-ACP methyl ester carboxylesterase
MHFVRASDGARLAFSDAGSGAVTLLLVHGWQADHSVWQDIVAALGAGVRTLAVDLRGSGASRGAPGPYRLERFAADLRDLIDTLALGPVVVVGHSMGATIALRFAVDAPQATLGLVLIAPVPAGGAGFSPKGAAYLRATAGDPVAAKNWLARTLAGTPDDATLERIHSAAVRTAPEVSLESFDSWAYADFAEATRTITVPALVIAPVYDAPDAADRKVAALLRNAEYVVLPETAHYAIVEQPAAIAALVRNFVDRLRVRADR